MTRRFCIDPQDVRLSPGMRLAIEGIRVALAQPERAPAAPAIIQSLEETFGEDD